MSRKKSKIKSGTIPPLLKSQKEKLEKQKLDKRKDEFAKSQRERYSTGTIVRRTGPENRAAAIGASPAKPYSQPFRVTGPRNRLEVLPQYNPSSSLPIRSTGSPTRRYVMEGRLTFQQFLSKLENID
jgi:hypothetical protein